MAQEQQFTPGFSLAGAIDLEELKHKVQAPAGADGGAPAAGGYVIDTDEGTFQAMVATSATFPILLLLWVSDDDRCFPIAQKLGDAVNAANGQLQLSRIDIRENPSIAQALQAQGAPALYALIAGRPMPILQGVPSDEELQQIVDTLIPQIVQLAQQSGVVGSAPYYDKGAAHQEYNGDSDGSVADSSASSGATSTQSSAQTQTPQAYAVPPEHAEADSLARQGDYAGAAEAYRVLLEANPADSRATRERAKALLLARSANADVRTVRAAAADDADNVDAQLAVADIDMIGGQVEDAFGRLLDFMAEHPVDIEAKNAVRVRLLEYFDIVGVADPRVARARRRLATLMY